MINIKSIIMESADGFRSQVRKLAHWRSVDWKRALRDFHEAVRALTRSIKAYSTDTPLPEQAMNVLVLVFGCTITAGGFYLLYGFAQSQAQRDFQRPGQEIADVLTASIKKHVTVAAQAAALFSDKKKGVNRWEFARFSRKILAKNGGIQAIEWIPRVPQKQRSVFEKRAKRDGIVKFSFFIRDGKIGRKVAPKRERYYPVYFVEPYSGNEEMLGYDLSDDVDISEELDKVRDAGKIVALPFSKNRKRFRQNPGFVIVQPVYGTEVLPFTVEERRRNLRGYVRVVIRLDKIMEQLRASLAVPPQYVISFSSRNKAGKTHLIYTDSLQTEGKKTPPTERAASSTSVHYTRTYSLPDWTLRIDIMPASHFFSLNIHSAPWIFLVFSLLLTAVLLMYLVVVQARARALEKSSRAKSDFLALMSHELRTPLNAVIGFSELMTLEVHGPASDQRYCEYAEHIRDSAEHLLSLINDILDLSKIEAEQFELRYEAFSLGDLWNNVHQTLSTKIEDTGLFVETNLEFSAIKVWADRRAFYQMLLNVLSNAVKFTPEGGRISVDANFDSDGSFKITVSDTGIGIAPADIKSTLEPFKQLENATARNFEGTGLGLPLTKRLAELHGGNLQIESEMDRGTTVTLAFESTIVYRDASEEDGPFDSDDGERATLTEAVGEAKL